MTVLDSAPESTSLEATPALEAREITKRFDGVHALRTRASRCARARSTPCSVRTARASPR